MIKRSPEQWQELFAAHQASGLSQAQFCKERKLCPKYFSLRRRQFTHHEGPLKHSPLVKVERPEWPSVSTVSLHYQGVDIQFAHADPGLIASVVKQLV